MFQNEKRFKVKTECEAWVLELFFFFAVHNLLLSTKHTVVLIGCRSKKINILTRKNRFKNALFTHTRGYSLLRVSIERKSLRLIFPSPSMSAVLINTCCVCVCVCVVCVRARVNER